MALDPNDYGAYAFVPGGYSAMDMRRRIAMQLMSGGKKAHPKTVGEGLSSIGDAIGDIAMFKYMERLAKEEQVKRERAMAPLVSGEGAAAGTGSVPATSASPRADAGGEVVVPVASAEPPPMDAANPAFAAVGEFPAPLPPVPEAQAPMPEITEGGTATVAKNPPLPPHTYGAMAPGAPRTMAEAAPWFDPMAAGVRAMGTGSDAPIRFVPSPNQISREQGGVGPVAAAPAAFDASGYRPAPAYLRAALAESGLPPERQAYLGHLASKEAQSAGEVSSTGAAGPFQFIRSTGRQYGLIGPEGDRRTNIAASIVAANRLTDDNAATLRAGLGREPTPGELALAHQQGAGTAVRMLTGTGNASPYNLAVNNAGGLNGRAAADKIMAYYNMPNAPAQAAPAPVQTAAASPTAGAQDEVLGQLSGRSGDASLSYAPTAALRPTGEVMTDAPPVSGIEQAIGDTVQARRDAIAKELQNQQAPQTAPAVPQPNPTMWGPGTPTTTFSPPQTSAARGSPNPPTVVSDIAPIPTAGAQTAQAQQRGAYVSPEPQRPVMKSPYELLPRDERERYAERLQYSDDPEIRRGAQVYLSQRKMVRDELSARETERFKTDDAIYRERIKARDEQVATQQKRTLDLLHTGGQINQQQYETGLKQLELKRATQEDASTTRYYGTEGKPPTEVMKALDESRDKAKSATGSLEAFANAKEVLDAGTAVGTGAQAKLLYYKARALAGDQDAARIVSNTESFQSSLGPAVMDAIKKYGGSQISNTDREYAAAMTGADINLTEAAARRIITIGERAARSTLDDHKRMVERDVGDRPRLKEYYSVSEPMPPVPGERAPQSREAIVNAPNEAEAMKLPPGTRFRLPDGRTGTVR